MIQIYSPQNTNFDMNGDMTLFPEVCEVEAELKGTWVLNITHPLDQEGRWKYIEEEAVISVPTFMGKKQLYRINERDKSDAEVSAKAYPIFFDSANEVFLMDMQLANRNGQEALDDMTTGTKYSGISNISTGNTAHFLRRNLLDAIAGTNEPTFLDTWGGEPLYNNFQVVINERAGGDYGAQVRYGMNMEGVNHRIDMTNVVTRIVPVAYNGRTLSTQYVDSPMIGNYAKVYTKEIPFEDVKLLSDMNDTENNEGIIVCSTQEALDAALIEKCNEQFASGIDLPVVTIEVDMVALENTEEYKDFADLVKISLGDTVGCYNFNLDITTHARVIKVTWDCITDSIKTVILGDYVENVFDKFGSTTERIESILNNDGTVMAERVRGILDGIKTQIKIQSTAAQPVDGRAFIVEDLDPESPMYGCMVFGTQGIQVSKKRTTDGRAWDFSTAMTASGIVANAIIAGLLSDKTGLNYWDLDKGLLNIGKGKIKLGSLFSVDEQGKVVADSLTSKNVNITGGIINIKGITKEYYPVEFGTNDGKILKAGPYRIRFESGDNFAEMSAGSIICGSGSGDNYERAQMLYDGSLSSTKAYSTTTSDSPNVSVWANGLFRRSSSSSERYKTDITEVLSEELNPDLLYDIPVKMFKYKDGYLEKDDVKNGKDVIGFVVEDMERIYPTAVQYVDGKPEMWNANILIPAMMKLIQEQNERIKRLEGKD